MSATSKEEPCEEIWNINRKFEEHVDVLFPMGGDGNKQCKECIDMTSCTGELQFEQWKRGSNAIA